MGISLLDRFEAKYIPEPNSGCWIWTGAPQRTRGRYGSFNYFGKPTPAHRVSWLLYRGEIPLGLYVLHRCDNGFCVNPDHLFLGTQQDNMDDMTKKGRWNSYAGIEKAAQVRKARTHCKRGHELTGDNLIVQPDGHRNCRACQQFHSRRSYEQRKELRP